MGLDMMGSSFLVLGGKGAGELFTILGLLLGIEFEVCHRNLDDSRTLIDRIQCRVGAVLNYINMRGSSSNRE